MSDENLPDPIRRWTARKRAALVMSILKGETTMQEAARKHDLTVAEIEGWSAQLRKLHRSEVLGELVDPLVQRRETASVVRLLEPGGIPDSTRMSCSLTKREHYNGAQD